MLCPAQHGFGVLLTRRSFICGASAAPGWPPLDAQPSRTAAQPPISTAATSQPNPQLAPIPSTNISEATNSRPKASPHQAVLCVRSISRGTRILPSPEPWVIPSSHSHFPSRPSPPERLLHTIQSSLIQYRAPGPRLITCGAWLKLPAMVLSRPDAGTHLVGVAAHVADWLFSRQRHSLVSSKKSSREKI